MLYASRNPEGKIIGISDTPSSSAEAIDNNHPDVRAFFSLHNKDFTPDSFLDQSDLAIARILDDLVDLLVKKNIIMFTELPDEAQKKLLSRRVVRSLLQNNDQSAVDDQTDKESSILSDEDRLL
ncbi:MAG: hypothetical protein MJK10_16100 [Pseudomonadales bacterium]|nr:hypothetical protein [Pseudomonadales bacterium]NRA17654.1 hypothetical protein [Oceanospirillaceae bacterium]